MLKVFKNLLAITEKPLFYVFVKEAHLGLFCFSVKYNFYSRIDTPNSTLKFPFQVLTRIQLSRFVCNFLTELEFNGKFPNSCLYFTLKFWRFSSRIEISTRNTKLKKNCNYMKNFNPGSNIIGTKKI